MPWVRSPIRPRFEKHFIPEPNSGCWLWVSTMHPAGYGRFTISHAENTSAHRASWMVYRGTIPAGLHVLHRCDVRCCVNPDHLFLGTNDDNVADKETKGRGNQPRGERCANAKLTEKIVSDLRGRARFQGCISAWARELGVDRHAIRQALNGKTWKHIIYRKPSDLTDMLDQLAAQRGLIF